MNNKKVNYAEQLTEGRSDRADVSRLADLWWATSDVYNLEKHLYYTIWVTQGEKKERYEKLLVEVRKIRADLMRKLIRDTSKLTGAEWCQLKHMIGAAAQLCEVAVKDFHMGNFEEGEELMEKANFFHDAFWATVSVVLKSGNDEGKSEDKGNVVN